MRLHSQDVFCWRAKKELTTDSTQNLQLPGANEPSSSSSSTPSSAQPTPESVQVLRRKVHETSKLHTALLSEKTRNEALITQLRGLLAGSPVTKTERPSSSSTRTTRRSGATASADAAATAAENASFAFLAQGAAAQNLGISLPSDGESASAAAVRSRKEPLKTNTAFALSQLPALRKLLMQLRPRVAALGVPGGVGPGTELSQARRAYVESQTKKLLERRGVDVKGGEGGAEGLGRRIQPEEVRGMEAVAGLVGVVPGGEGGEEGGEGDRMEE